MVDRIDQKIVSGFEKIQDRGIVTGMYAFNESTGKLNRCNIDDNGDFKVNIHSTAGGGDMKARTDIADPATSTFIKCNTDGTLELTAELDSSALAKSAIQTDGTQVSKAMGSEDGTKTGTQKQLRVDGNGRLSVDINSGIPTKTDGTAGHSPATGIGLIGFDGATARAVKCDSDGKLVVASTSTDNVKLEDLSSQVNSGITDDPNNSLAVGLRARQTITSSATETFLKCNATGALAVEVATNSAEIKAEDDTGSARNIRCNNSGHVKSACIGAESDGTLRQIQTNEVGQLKVKLLADDGATRREVRCDASGKLSVVDGETTQSPHTLFSGTQVIGASPASFSFDSAGATAILEEDGLTKATYVIVGSGTSSSLEVSEMIGDTNSTLATNISSTKFMTGLSNFSFSADGVGKFRGLNVKNLSSNSYTITSIKVVYNK